MPLLVFLGGLLVSIGRRAAASDAGLEVSMAVNFWWLFVSVVMLVPWALWHFALAQERELALRA